MLDFVVMKSVIVLLIVMLSAFSAAAETVGVCSEGKISSHELQVWLDARLGRTQDCTGAIEEIAVAKLLAAQGHTLGLDNDPVVARKLAMIGAMAWRDAAKRAVQDGAPSPSEEDISALLAERGTRFAQPARIRLMWIFRYAAADDADARLQESALLNRLRTRILDGEISFGEAARLHSQSESRNRDGSAGTLTADEISPQLAEIVFALPEGELSQVISGSTGFHLFRVEKMIPPRYSTDVEKQERARSLLMKRSRSTSWDRFNQDVLRIADPAIDLGNLDADNPEAIVLKLATGENLTAAQTHDMGRISPEKATRRLTEIAFLMKLPEVAAKLGYELDEATRIEYDLRRTRRLATEVMNRIQEEEVVAPTDNEIAAEWALDRPKYRGPNRYRLWRVRFDLATDGSVEQINRLRSALKGPEAELEPIEDGETTEGWFDNPALSEMGSVAAKAVRTAQDSGVLGPFRRGYDLWLIRVLEHQEGRKQPLADVSAAIARDLEAGARQAVFSHVLDDQLIAGAFKTTGEPDCLSGDPSAALLLSR